MNVLDTNIVINNIKSKCYECGYISDITFFERFKSIPEETRIIRFRELDEYVNKSKSILLCFGEKHHDDVFNQSIPFETRYKNAIKIAIFAANELWRWFTYMCSVLTLCYVMNRSGYKFDCNENAWVGDNDSYGDASYTAYWIMKRLDQYFRSNPYDGEKLINEKMDINKQSHQLSYVNGWIKFHNQASFSPWKIPCLKELNGHWLKQGKLKYSDKFVKDIINQFFNFTNNDEFCKSMLFACAKEILNGASFEFNDIADVITIAIAKSKNIPLKTNDKVMKNIAKTMSVITSDE